MISAPSLLCPGNPPPPPPPTKKEKNRDLPLHHRTSFWFYMTFDLSLNLSSTLYNFSEIHKTRSFRLGLTRVQQPVWPDCHGMAANYRPIVVKEYAIFVCTILCAICARQKKGTNHYCHQIDMCVNLSDQLLMHC